MASETSGQASRRNEQKTRISIKTKNKLFSGIIKGFVRKTSPTGQQSRAKLHKTTQLHTTHNYITSYYILNILHTYYILTYYILTYILTYLHTYIITYLPNYLLTY